jgi:hypothetical protein
VVFQTLSLSVNNLAIQQREVRSFDVGKEVTLWSPGNHRHLTTPAECRQRLGQLQLVAGVAEPLSNWMAAPGRVDAVALLAAWLAGEYISAMRKPWPRNRSDAHGVLL